MMVDQGPRLPLTHAHPSRIFQGPNLPGEPSGETVSTADGPGASDVLEKGVQTGVRGSAEEVLDERPERA
jgi:hypothetical protein